MNDLMTLDLSPFFIYQEQANSVADHLSIIFEEELTDLNYTFSNWINQFINNLKRSNLPTQKDSVFGNNFFFLGVLVLILSPIIPVFIVLLNRYL
jgi:hypothetical protein